MRDLNRIYRGKDRVTDVLSFSQLEGLVSGACGPSIDLGDIVINPAQALRQARACGETFEREMSRLLVHGLLHLLGYDHEKNRYQARRMRVLEEDILGAIYEVVGQRK
jgi:probable rRNA maturation factor